LNVLKIKIKGMTKQQLTKLSLSDLHSLKQMVQDEINDRADDMRYTLNPGDAVKVNHRKTANKTFVVVEIRRKKALLEDITNRYRYNVALSLIEKTNKITLG
jgi:hypothetical protein